MQIDWNQIGDAIVNFFTNSGFALLEFIAILILGLILIKILMKVLRRIFKNTKLDPVAQRFIVNMIKFTCYLLLFIALAQVIGIPITGFIAIISAAGLALSLALQGSLSNLANGLVIIITKPFKEGDYVKITGIEGKVKEIKMLHTILLTTDNKLVSIPNKTVVENDITNFNGNKTRKVTFEFSVAYEADVEETKKIISDCIRANPKTLDLPLPFVALKALDSSSINFTANCWCKAEQYWDVYYEVTESVFNELKKHNVSIPFNQLEVRMREEEVKLPYNPAPLPERTIKNIIEEENPDAEDDLIFFKLPPIKKRGRKPKEKNDKASFQEKQIDPTSTIYQEFPEEIEKLNKLEEDKSKPEVKQEKHKKKKSKDDVIL